MPTIESKKIEEYLDEICLLVKNKKVHESIKEEIRNHIEEISMDYIDVGVSEEEAIEKALLQMGSSEIVGRKLNKVHKAAPDWMLLIISSLFIFTGIVTMIFIKFNNELNPYTTGNFLERTIIFSVLGIILSVVMLKIHYKNLKKYSPYIYCGILLLLIMNLFVAGELYGVNRLIWIGSHSLNVVTIAPFFLIISLAGIFNDWNWNSIKGVFLGGILAFIPAVLLMLVNDTTDATIYLGAVITLMFISGIKIKHIVTCIGTILVMFLGYIFSSPYRIHRFFMIMNPSRSENTQQIYNEIKPLISSAGLFGNGANLSINKFPALHTDFIFTYIVNVFGWVVGIVLLALVLAFIMRIGVVGKQIRENYGKSLVCGLCAMFITQYLFSIVSNLGLSLVTFTSMPFISYGGSQLIMNILAVGIICNVYKWRNTPCKESIKI